MSAPSSKSLFRAISGKGKAPAATPIFGVMPVQKPPRADKRRDHAGWNR